MVVHARSVVVYDHLSSFSYFFSTLQQDCRYSNSRPRLRESRGHVSTSRPTTSVSVVSIECVRLQVSTFLLFVLPMILITVLYIRIGIALRQSAIATGLDVTPPAARWTSKNGGATAGGEKNTNSRQTRRVVSQSTCSKVAQSRRSIFKMLSK